MRLAIGCDHAAYEVKNEVIAYLKSKGHELVDVSEADGTRVDYPDIAGAAAAKVLSNEVEFGILFCGTGIGISIAANKVPGIRAALCHDAYTASMARAHNNAQIVCAGARVTGAEVIKQIVEVFLTTSFEGGRHGCRVDKIMALEAPQSC
jgi:ribose 5-phosphate isomerase B